MIRPLLLLCCAGLMYGASVSSMQTFLKLEHFDPRNPENLTILIKKDLVLSVVVLKEDNSFMLKITTSELEQNPEGGSFNRVYAIRYNSSDAANTVMNLIAKNL